METSRRECQNCFKLERQRDAYRQIAFERSHVGALYACSTTQLEEVQISFIKDVDRLMEQYAFDLKEYNIKLPDGFEKYAGEIPDCLSVTQNAGI